MLQHLHNRRFLLRRTLRHFGIFLLRQVIVLPHIQPALPFDLGDIQAGHLQAVLFQHIGFDLIIGGFTLRRCQIQLIQIQLHLDMLLGIEFGQKNYRLIVYIKSEHIPTKSRKYRQYLYSINTARASLFPQNISSINFAPP